METKTEERIADPWLIVHAIPCPTPGHDHMTLRLAVNPTKFDLHTYASMLVTIVLYGADMLGVDENDLITEAMNIRDTLVDLRPGQTRH